MTLVTHAIVGMAIGRFFPDTPAVVPVLMSLLPDADHVVPAARSILHGRGLGRTRTVFHEVLGAGCWGLAGFVLALAAPDLGSLMVICAAIHLLLDYVSGSSTPFTPRTREQVQLTLQPAHRLAEELVVVACSLAVICR